MTAPDQMRAMLSQRLSELEARAARLMESLREPMSADFEEQAVEAEDDEPLLAQETLAVQEIAQVRAAIKRVDEGRYGICLGCGEPIAPARLAALPEATHCIDCATTGEQQ